jgi:hypothetical protein
MVTAFAPPVMTMSQRSGALSGYEGIPEVEMALI